MPPPANCNFFLLMAPEHSTPVILAVYLGNAVTRLIGSKTEVLLGTVLTHSSWVVQHMYHLSHFKHAIVWT